MKREEFTNRKATAITALVALETHMQEKADSIRPLIDNHEFVKAMSLLQEELIDSLRKRIDILGKTNRRLAPRNFNYQDLDAAVDSLVRKKEYLEEMMLEVQNASVGKISDVRDSTREAPLDDAILGTAAEHSLVKGQEAFVTTEKTLSSVTPETTLETHHQRKSTDEERLLMFRRRYQELELNKKKTSQMNTNFFNTLLNPIEEGSSLADAFLAVHGLKFENANSPMKPQIDTILNEMRQLKMEPLIGEKIIITHLEQLWAFLNKKITPEQYRVKSQAALLYGEASNHMKVFVRAAILLASIAGGLMLLGSFGIISAATVAPVAIAATALFLASGVCLSTAAYNGYKLFRAPSPKRLSEAEDILASSKELSTIVATSGM